MVTSIDKLCVENHLKLSETAYCKSRKEMLDFRIVSGNYYEFSQKGEKNIIKYKNCVEIMDFPMLVEALPCLKSIDYIKRNDFPYFTSGLNEIAKKMETGEPVAVEGGPCLFGTDEVTVEITKKNGKKIYFDYNTGKSYQDDGNMEETTDFREFALNHGEEIREIHFENRKSDLTPQEWGVYQVSV